MIGQVSSSLVHRLIHVSQFCVVTNIKAHILLCTICAQTHTLTHLRSITIIRSVHNQAQITLIYWHQHVVSFHNSLATIPARNLYASEIECLHTPN